MPATFITINDANGVDKDVVCYSAGALGLVQGFLMLDEDGLPLASFGITGNVTVDSHIKRHLVMYDSAARTADPTEFVVTSPYNQGAIVLLKITAGSGFSITPKLRVKDSSGAFTEIHAFGAVTTTGTKKYVIAPYDTGLTVDGELVMGLPLQWSLLPDHADATSVTYSQELLEL